MEKEFIPYEQALALKELGFEDYCVGMYAHAFKNTIENQFVIHTCKASSKLVWMKMPAPLYQQAFRWFREKYNLLHEITGIHSIEPFELDCRTLNIYNGDTWVLSYRGNSYEEAELACLKKLIEIVKNK